MKLSSEQLYSPVLSHQLGLQEPQDLTDSSGTFGQQRAVEALEFGLHVLQPGYNIYMAGDNGTGRYHYIIDYLSPLARQQPSPEDWLYVNNLDNLKEPRAISMPHQQGLALQRHIEELIEEVLATFPAAFDHPSYQQQKTALQHQFDRIYDQAVEVVERQAIEKGVAIYRENGSVTFMPLIDGEIADETMFARLQESEREQFHQDVIALEYLLNEALLELPTWQRRLNEQLRELQSNVIKRALKPLLEKLQSKHYLNAGVQLYLAQLAQHLPRIILEELSDEGGKEAKPSVRRKLLRDLYRPNVLVHTSGDHGAPVIHEPNPSYSNLIGHIDVTTDQANPTVSHQQISAGSLHRANGGYLIMDVEKLLREPQSWEALKRALRTNKLCIENVPDIQTANGGLRPEAIPLKVKVILIGPGDIYYTLARYDRDFDELFRILADFDSHVPRNPESLSNFSVLVLQRAEALQLAPLKVDAIVRLAELSGRLAEHQQRLSAKIDQIMEVATEADEIRKREGAETITELHIGAAIDAQTRRNARLKELVTQNILEGTVFISTEGNAVGQINGLSVIQVGESSFGCPTRITATTHPGSEGVVDIERESELGLAVHSKGVMILSGYLAGRYARDFPLALSAHIALEQSYGFIDGDSASLAEICALISALTNLPLNQQFAVTGSINQRGEVQPVGGVNEKIEGFFDICRARGLSGDQGVIIPATNCINLMLSKTVVDAVERGEFAVHAVASVDEALALLTGVEIGRKESCGGFPANSVNGLTVAALRRYAEITHTYKGRS